MKTDGTIVLNEYQRAAVEDESRACLVKANVGSGKTTVLVEKLRYLHEKKGVPYERMVVLTFTNKAADEILERLAGSEAEGEGNMASPSGFADLYFGTFHSVALHLLRENLPIETLGYASGFAVIDPDEEAELAASLIEEHGLQIKYKNRLKKRLEQEEKAWRQGREQSRLKDDLFLLFPLLEQEKVRLNKFSFSDLIRVAARLLKETEQSGAADSICRDRPAEETSLSGRKEFRKPDWIVVDEVQDSDRQQLDFISALMGDKTRLFAVGDPNQVIYSWRGGAENIFFLLAREFGAKEMSLPVNYRSNGMILDAARSFQQSGDRLQGVREGGKPVQVHRHYDPFGEAQYLADRIAGLIAEGVSADEIAVFYRLQSQSELLEKEFARRQIPYRVSLKRTASDLPVIRWLIRALRYACNPADHSSALAVLTDKNYGPGLTAKKARAALNAASGGDTLLDRLRGLGNQGIFADAQELYAYLKLDEALNPASASFFQDRAWALEFLSHALSHARVFMGEQEMGECVLGGLNDFLNSSALYGLRIGDELEEEIRKMCPAVRLMTLHASKGLEFQYVFIIGVNYGLIPLTARDEEDEEEERRLFFVGMTRAKDCLELSYYVNPGMARVAPGESRYLSMIPQYLLEREEQREMPKADLTALRRAAAKLRDERREVGAGQGGGQAEAAEEPCEEGREAAAEQCGECPEDKKEQRPQRVRHARYGMGTVLEETENKIKVQFDSFGEKEFVKAFTALERLAD